MFIFNRWIFINCIFIYDFIVIIVNYLCIELLYVYLYFDRYESYLWIIMWIIILFLKNVIYSCRRKKNIFFLLIFYIVVNFFYFFIIVIYIIMLYVWVFSVEDW